MGTTPIYGFPYPDPSDLVANYPALGQQLAEDIEDVLPTIGGLAIVAPTSIANSGGTASATDGEVTFSGVTTISLNGVFSASYQNYLILIIATSGSGTNLTQIRWRVAGADNSTASSYIVQELFVNGASVGAGRTTSNLAGIGEFSTSGSFVTTEVSRVFETDQTVHLSSCSSGRSGGTLVHNAGTHNQSVSYDGFTIIPSASTLTGKLRVYGYRNS